MSGHRSLLFATGGTGGHIYPALAVAREATEQGYDVVFLGQAGGMEERIVPFEGFTFYGVEAGKWDRKRPNPLQAVKAFEGFGQALRIVKRFGPDLVIGFGGFASFPGLAAAKLLGIPYVLHEGNAFPGRVTRWFAPGAQRVAISHEAVRPRLTGKKLAYTGFPVREQKVVKAEARERLELPLDGALTLVMGGSQGSAFLNEAVPQAFQTLSAPTAVLHSTGQRWLEQVYATTYAFPNYFTRDFVDATLAWSAADVAITRAGVSTLSEAAFHGVPLVMVPLPSAAENHQYHNAQAVAQRGAGWVVEEGDGALASAWQKALGPGRNEASRAALRLSPEGAAEAFMHLINDVLAPPVVGRWQESR